MQRWPSPSGLLLVWVMLSAALVGWLVRWVFGSGTRTPAEAGMFKFLFTMAYSLSVSHPMIFVKSQLKGLLLKEHSSNSFDNQVGLG